MAVNIITLSKMQETSYALKLYEVLGEYIMEYLLNDDHAVAEKVEDKTVALLQECNTYAEANGLPALCDIYDVFGLEQDAAIIYHMVADYLIREKQQIEECEITIKRRYNSSDQMES
ncbi:hypothetical protein ACUIJQ_05620 [Levilactobacillus hammesii]|uniref:hypothetical protein n=1 Tax=Levilactobacillus hammesii TaxID=267633 RepID=UPI00070D709F|nr:hypothetical protein [Levilactobacillus hammesii]